MELYPPQRRNTRLNTAQPAAALAGGERSVIIITTALPSFFNMQGAAVLRTVTSELRDAIAAFPWDAAQSTGVIGHVVQWRSCFPSARKANLRGKVVPSEAFVCLRDIARLNLKRSHFPTAALLTDHYPRPIGLNLSGWHAFMDSDLAGLHCPLLTSLKLKDCVGLTDASLVGLQCPLLTSPTCGAAMASLTQAWRFSVVLCSQSST